MNIHITQNDLLLLAYNELDAERESLVIKEIDNNPHLRSEYLNILATMDCLDQYLVQPNNTSLQIILEESSSAMEVH